MKALSKARTRRCIRQARAVMRTRIDPPLVKAGALVLIWLRVQIGKSMVADLIGEYMPPKTKQLAFGILAHGDAAALA